MRNTGIILTALAALAVAFLFSTHSRLLPETAAGAEDEENEVDAIQQPGQGALLVRLSDKTQALAGIKTTPTKRMTLQAEHRAFATVIDINELLLKRADYTRALASRGIIQASLDNAGEVMGQLEALHKEAGNISASKLQDAKARYDLELARLRAADVELKHIRAAMIQKWHTTLTEQALKERSILFERLVNGDELVVLVSLKAGQKLSKNQAFVFLGRTDDRHRARKGYFISSAPFSDHILQGETFFFRTHAEGIRIGMRLYVWLPGTGFSGAGVHIPTASVIWYAGEPWSYVQTDEELFERRSLLNPIRSNGGWLVRENFQAGEEIVISGAQTLLSEELKWAIPDEDND